jgi:hypothetical protein
MRNPEEFSDQQSDLTRVLPTYRRPGSQPGRGTEPGSQGSSRARPSGPRAPGTGRIRYAHSGMLPRAEPFCTVPQGAFGHREGDGDARDVRDARGGDARGGDARGGDARGGDARGGDAGDGDELGNEAWLTEFPATGFPAADRGTDLWVLVCGGIAAAAAFAAAFVASGGVASHPATPASVPAVVSQACPSPSPGPTPTATTRP